jgi:hypothetical protein
MNITKTFLPVMDSVRRPPAITAMRECTSVVVLEQIVPAMVCSVLIVSKGIIVNHVVKIMIGSVCHHAYVMVMHAGIVSAMVALMQVIGTYWTRKRRKKEIIELGYDAKTFLVLYFTSTFFVRIITFIIIIIIISLIVMPIHVANAAPFSAGDARITDGAQNAKKCFAIHVQHPFIANFVMNQFVLIVINRVESSVPIAENPLVQNAEWYIAAEGPIHYIVTGVNLDSIVKFVKLSIGTFGHVIL